MGGFSSDAGSRREATAAAASPGRDSPRPLRFRRARLEVLEAELVLRRIGQRDAPGRAEAPVDVEQLARLHERPGARLGHRLAGDDDAGDVREVLAAHADGARGAGGIEVAAAVRLALEDPQLVRVGITE